MSSSTTSARRAPKKQPGKKRTTRRNPAPRVRKEPKITRAFITGREMAERHADGKSIAEIAERNQITTGRVCQMVRAATGMSPSEYRLANGWVTRLLSPQTAARVRAAYRADPRATNIALAQRAGASPAAVAQVLASLPEPVHRTAGEPAMDLGVTTEELIALYVDERLNTVQLGERLGADPSTVARHLKRAGIQLRRKGGALAFPLAEAIRLYTNQQYTPAMLARRYNVTTDTIVWQLDKAGVYEVYRDSAHVPLSNLALLEMFERDKPTVRAIAERYGVSTATVTRRLARAREEREAACA